MKIILDETYIFSPKDDKTNFCVCFHVPEGYDALRCECYFTPKTVNDMELNRQAVIASIGKYVPRESIGDYQLENLSLVNHITFSLDFEDKYIGCAHRHAAKAVHTISMDGSSPGFIRQGADAGTWRAVINIHSITSPKVEYSLKIYAIPQGGSVNGI